MSANQLLLTQENANGDFAIKILTPEAGKLIGFDSNLNPIMVEAGSGYAILTNGCSLFQNATAPSDFAESMPNLVSGYQMFYNANAQGTTFSITASGNLVNCGNMFYNANFSSITSFTLSDMPNVTNVSNMFYNAKFSSITSFTLSDMPNVTSASNMFNSANFSSITSFTLSDMPNVTSASTMFYSAFLAPLLTSITIPSTFGAYGTGVMFTSMFTNSTTFAGTLNVNCKVNQLQIQGSSSKLTQITGLRMPNQNSLFSGTSPQIDISYTNLDATALNTLFTDLPTVTGKTINITGATGAGTCDKTIATGKNWTILG